MRSTMSHDIAVLRLTPLAIFSVEKGFMSLGCKLLNVVRFSSHANDNTTGQRHFWHPSQDFSHF